MPVDEIVYYIVFTIVAGLILLYVAIKSSKDEFTEDFK